MHDIIEQMKAGLEDLEYQIPEDAWERFQVKEQNQPISVKKRNFFYLRAAAIFLIIFMLTLQLQREHAFINSEKIHSSSKVSGGKSMRASTPRQLSYASKMLNKQNRIESQSKSIFASALVKTTGTIIPLNSPATIIPTKVVDSAASLKEAKLDRWMLADITSKGNQRSAFKIVLGENKNQPKLYFYEKTNGKQSLIVKSRLEEHPSKYSSYNSYQSSEVRVPQDFSIKQNPSGNGIELSHVSAAASAGGEGEVGSVGSEGMSSPPPTRPSPPSWHPTGSLAGTVNKTNGFDPRNNGDANNTSSKTRNLQNLEFYDLSIGFKQKLKKEQTIKFEPFLRIPVTGFQNKQQFNYNQYGLKIGLSF